jgi:hypothetical protein
MAPVIAKMPQTNDNNTTSQETRRKTPAHTLIRVRNNQRRHRERRREYISSLEQKLQETQGLLAQSKANVAALKAELEIWKSRINGTGEYFDGSTGSTLTLDNVGNPPTLFPVKRQPTEAEQQQGSRVDVLRQISPLAPYSESPSETAFVTTAVTPDLPAAISTTIDFRITDLSTLSIVPSPEPSPTSLTGRPGSPQYHTPSAFPPRCCSLVDEPPTAPFVGTTMHSSSAPEAQDVTLLPSACHTYPPSDLESTTLCSQAYILIAQQNFRGSNEYTIRSWLYQGFRRAKGHDEGCRVENKLLFGLLDFISGA